MFLGKLVLFFNIIPIFLCLRQNQSWTEFVEEVQIAVDNSTSYILPVDNREFFSPNHSNVTECYGAFDFIIVGGGTAGGVVANRLTEKNFTVLVIEAGTKSPSWSSILGLSPYLYQTKYNWGYNTTTQKNACLGMKNQQCFYPRGKVLGGSSVINGGMYVRGNAEDYDRWEELGNEGWSYKDCLYYFKKAETADFTKNIDKGYHGFNGPQHIGVPNDTPELTIKLLKAFEELGKPIADTNGKIQSNDRMQFFLNYNERASSAEAFLAPAFDRTNLNISTQSFVDRILIANKTAYGVEFVKSGRTFVAYANKEVILSAGAINSPQILMLSGIGPKGELENLGIDVIQDLPVGKNLLDHLMSPAVYFRTNQSFYNMSLVEKLNRWKKAERPLTAGINVHTLSFWKYTGTPQTRPDVEIFMHNAADSFYSSVMFNDEYVNASKMINNFSDIVASVAILHPKSKGSVTLLSKDPRDFPLIDPNYYSEPDDIEIMYQGIQTALLLSTTKTFQNWKAEFLKVPAPGCDGNFPDLSKEWWFCYIRHISVTLYHPVGTTRMGVHPNTSVVDRNLKVHGIDNLRVVDAGVFPEHVSGHTNAAVVMIAEKISDNIKKNYS